MTSLQGKLKAALADPERWLDRHAGPMVVGLIVFMYVWLFVEGVRGVMAK